MRRVHEHRDVIPVREPMKTPVEERAGQHNVPGMNFPYYRRVDVCSGVEQGG